MKRRKNVRRQPLALDSPADLYSRLRVLLASRQVECSRQRVAVPAGLLLANSRRAISGVGRKGLWKSVQQKLG
jgi:hypothetical protein